MIWLSSIKQKKTQVAFIVTLWLITQITLYTLLGIRPILESLKYIGAAEYLIQNGQLPEVRYYFYLSTTIAIAFSLKIQAGILGAVIIQILLNLLATLSFYFSLWKKQNNPLSALITTTLLIVCIPYQIWNIYLYTESLFYSFVLLFFSMCIRFESISIKILFIQLIFLVLAIISRPLGILLLPCWIILLVIKSSKIIRPILIVSIGIGVFILLFASNLILGNIGDWQILKPAEYKYIICDIPTSEKLLLNISTNQSPINQLLHYVVLYPKEFFELALKRLNAFLFLIRSYYSFWHNISLIILSIVLYIPIVINSLLISKRSRHTSYFFALTIILIFSLAVCLQCDDYHNRFHHTLIPIFLYCGIFLFIENLPSVVNNFRMKKLQKPYYP